MAVDALEYDESAEDANPAGALEEILENPERLKDLDLDAFAEELERQVSQQITPHCEIQVEYISCIFYINLTSRAFKHFRVKITVSLL